MCSSNNKVTENEPQAVDNMEEKQTLFRSFFLFVFARMAFGEVQV